MSKIHHLIRNNVFKKEKRTVGTHIIKNWMAWLVCISFPLYKPSHNLVLLYNNCIVCAIIDTVTNDSLTRIANKLSERRREVYNRAIRLY